MDARKATLSPPLSSDVLLVGGGLANSLIALRLRAARPDLRITLLEREPEADEAHTWCLFEPDVAVETWTWLSPLFEHVWEGYSVEFPAHDRALTTRYACLTSRALAHAVQAELGPRLHRGVEGVTIGSEEVVCRDGQVHLAPLVIDGRGARPSPHLRLAWQKFVGLEVQLKRPHGLERPVVMDGSVRQADGFRFLYVLPLTRQRLHIEDTRYSDGPGLDAPALETEVARYARARGWQIAQTLRREQGVLPVALGGDIDAYWNELPAAVPSVGLRGALFHPTTGYSLPEAARTAEQIAAAPTLASAEVASRVRERSKRLWRERDFYRTLNRMMFLAADPDERYRVLERFYRLPQPLIERFYAGRLRLTDKARILAGRPPVPVGRALAALPESALDRAHA